MTDDTAALVAVIMGSQSDWETMRHADEMLTRFGVPHECRIVSAHRTPAWLTEQGWTVARAALNSEHGSTSIDGSRRVRIHDDLSPAHAAVTILHEAGHALLHATMTDYHQHRGIYETEAEAIAYVTAGVLGLDTSANSIGYIAGWTRGDVDTVKATAARVLETVRTILDGITDDDATDS